MRRKTHDEYITELADKNPNILVKGRYINSTTKIKFECLKCGYVWETTPGPLLQGHGCPKCANNIRKTTDSFRLEMQKFNPYIEVEGEYINANTPIGVKCKICGNVWKAKPARLLYGAQCMNCVKPHTSFMEQFILISLKQILGENKVLSRETEAIGQELDIYIPEYKLAIEPGSWLFHEKKVFDIDQKKRKECEKRGIRLITVYDTYPQNLEPPYKYDCFVYSGFLNEYGYERIKNLVSELLRMLGYDAFNLDWDIIANEAYEACHYNANESFVEEMKANHPNIEIMEEYKGSNIPILVKSKTCNHPAWKARPYTLLKGNGCPLCGKELAAKNRTRTHEEFVNELKKLNPRIKIVGEFKRINERIDVECLDCGHRWNPLAYSLTQGKGCPHCSAVLGAKNRKGRLAAKTTDQYILEIAKCNSDIEICGEYVNNKTKIDARCKNCGYEWKVVPASLLNGHGCPMCAKINRKK